MPELAFPTEDYIRFDPCAGEDGDIRLRRIKLVRARKEHVCFLAGGTYGDGHSIKPGDTYRDEVALVDSDYWGHYRVCVPCMDKFLSDVHGEGEDED